MKAVICVNIKIVEVYVFEHVAHLRSNLQISLGLFISRGDRKYFADEICTEI